MSLHGETNPTPVRGTMFDLDSHKRPGRKAGAAALVALATAGALLSQTPTSTQDPAPDSGFTLQQTVRRVRVDVIVTDAEGHAVPHLQADDFRVSEDGIPQSIRQFEWHGPQNIEPAVPTRPTLPPHTFMNLMEAPEHGPLTVLLFDLLNTPLQDQPYAHAQMSDFLKKNTGHQTAIFVLGDRLRLLQGFTSDTELLERAATGKATMQQRPALQAGAPSQTGSLSNIAGDAMSVADRQTSSNPNATAAQPAKSGPAAALQQMQDRMAHMEAEEASARLDQRVDITLDALAQIGRFLAGVTGRKNLIWYSGSFPAGVLPDPDPPLNRDDAIRNYSEQMRVAGDLLNAAQVAVYPVDTRGLQTDPYFSASQSSPIGGGHQDTHSFGQQLAADFATMDTLGEQTGGRAFYNTNGLELALETAAADGSSYYSLLYAPTNPKFDGSVRHIKVQLEHKRYQLAYRRSYFADDPDEVVHPQTDEQEADNLARASIGAASQFGAPPSHQLIFAAQVDAVGMPVLATKLQMDTLTPYGEQAAKAAPRKFVPESTPVKMQKYAIQYAVLASQLDLPASANGNYHLRLSIATLAFNADGEALYGSNSRIADVIRPSDIAKVMENGYPVLQVFLAPVDTAVLRLVVRDEHNGRIGSMEVRLPLPPTRSRM